MRRTLTICAGCVVLLCAVAFSVVRTASVKAAPAALAKAAAAAASEHPNYREAINDLRNARKLLEKAEADGYGHRDQAMRAIDRAIEECNRAVEILR